MNANALYINQDYAYHPYKGNNEFMRGAHRVKVLRVIKPEVMVSKRNTTMVLVKFLNNDGSPKLEYVNGLKVAVPDDMVRARDILDSWEHYQLELESRSEATIDWSEYAS